MSSVLAYLCYLVFESICAILQVEGQWGMLKILLSLGKTLVTSPCRVKDCLILPLLEAPPDSMSLEGKERWYQQEAIERGKLGNLIVHIPTGMGKTLIACRLADYFVEHHSDKKILFVVKSRTLTSQHEATCRQQCRIARGMVVLTGESTQGWEQQEWQQCQQNNCILLGTEEVLRCALVEKRYLRPEQLSLVIFDECHNTKAGSPSASIMHDSIRPHYGNCLDMKIDQEPSEAVLRRKAADLQMTEEERAKLFQIARELVEALCHDSKGADESKEGTCFTFARLGGGVAHGVATFRSDGDIVLVLEGAIDEQRWAATARAAAEHIQTVATRLGAEKIIPLYFGRTVTIRGCELDVLVTFVPAAAMSNLAFLRQISFDAPLNKYQAQQVYESVKELQSTANDHSRDHATAMHRLCCDVWSSFMMQQPREIKETVLLLKAFLQEWWELTAPGPIKDQRKKLLWPNVSLEVVVVYTYTDRANTAVNISGPVPLRQLILQVLRQLQGLLHSGLVDNVSDSSSRRKMSIVLSKERHGAWLSQAEAERLEQSLEGLHVLDPVNPACNLLERWNKLPRDTSKQWMLRAVEQALNRISSGIGSQQGNFGATFVEFAKQLRQSIADTTPSDSSTLSCSPPPAPAPQAHVLPRILALTASFEAGNGKHLLRSREELEKFLQAEFYSPDLSEWESKQSKQYVHVQWKEQQISESEHKPQLEAWLAPLTKKIWHKNREAISANAWFTLVNLGMEGVRFYIAHGLIPQLKAQAENLNNCESKEGSQHNLKNKAKEYKKFASWLEPQVKRFLKGAKQMCFSPELPVHSSKLQKLFCVLESELKMIAHSGTHEQVTVDAFLARDCTQQRGSDSPSRELRAIIFVSRVVTTYPLCALLNAYFKDKNFSLPASGVSSMRSEDFEHNLAAFRAGGVRALVATPALEEGVDVPDCNVVVRFDTVDTIKSHVQAQGRARHQSARFYYFHDDPEKHCQDHDRLKEVSMDPTLSLSPDTRKQHLEREFGRHCSTDPNDIAPHPYITQTGGELNLFNCYQVMERYCARVLGSVRPDQQLFQYSTEQGPPTETTSQPRNEPSPSSASAYSVCSLRLPTTTGWLQITSAAVQIFWGDRSFTELVEPARCRELKLRDREKRLFAYVGLIYLLNLSPPMLTEKLEASDLAVSGCRAQCPLLPIQATSFLREGVRYSPDSLQQPNASHEKEL
eukprot:g60297.t1